MILFCALASLSPLISIEKKTAERAEHLRTMSSLDEVISRDGQGADEVTGERRALEADRDAMRQAEAALRERIEALERQGLFRILRTVEESRPNRRRAPMAVAIFFGALAAATLTFFPCPWRCCWGRCWSS